jgi:hypothetical protein
MLMVFVIYTLYVVLGLQNSRHGKNNQLFHSLNQTLLPHSTPSTIHLIIHPIMAHSVVGTLAPCFATVIDEKLRDAATNLHLVIPADNGANLSRFVYMGCHST